MVLFSLLELGHGRSARCAALILCFSDFGLGRERLQGAGKLRSCGLRRTATLPASRSGPGGASDSDGTAGAAGLPDRGGTRLAKNASFERPGYSDPCGLSLMDNGRADTEAALGVADEPRGLSDPASTNSHASFLRVRAPAVPGIFKALAIRARVTPLTAGRIRRSFDWRRLGLLLDGLLRV